MASNYTSNYNLCQWAASDKVLRTEFNADNAKIDAAIKAVDGLVTSLAGSKADKSTVTSLSSTVAGHTGELARKGNCVLHSITYTGNGKYGTANPRTLTFPGKPWLVILGHNYGFVVMVQGAVGTVAATGSNGPEIKLSWSGNSVSWYNTQAAANMYNESGTTYYAVAFLKADE